MLLGLRLRVWIPSFFMLSGRLTCNERRMSVVVDSPRGTPPNLPPRASYHPLNKRICSRGDN